MRFLPFDGASWSDARGWGLRPVEKSGLPYGGVGDVHVVSLEPGAVRGNHHHPGVTEWMLVFGAPVTLAWRDPDGAVRTVRVDGPEPVFAEVAPGVPHALRCEGPGTAYLVSWADGPPTTERGEPLL